MGERRIAHRLENQGPFGRTMRPEVDFVVDPVSDERSRVSLVFNAAAPLPFGLRHVVELGMGRWVRRLHVKDLQMLKHYVESGDLQRTPLP